LVLYLNKITARWPNGSRVCWSLIRQFRS